MGRHLGRRGTTPPGTGAGGDPAAGTAATPPGTTMTSATVPAELGTAPVHPPAPTAEALLALANEVCGLYARAEVARAMAGLSSTEAEHAHLLARAGHWDAHVSVRYRALVEALNAALPGTAQPERFMPVRPLSNGNVELHAHDTSARRLVVLLTGAQALAVGAHLTAYGAISLDRIGQKPDAGLPLVKAAPPFATATTPAADPPSGSAVPPADQP